MNTVNRMHEFRNVLKFFLFVVAAVVFFSNGSASTVEKLLQGTDDVLLETYHSIESKLEKNNFGVPLYLESSDKDGRVHVDVYGIFNYPFASVIAVLKVPANWCDIISIHPNIKACTYRELPAVWQLTFYSGRKIYQSPEKAYQSTYNFRNVEQRQGYLNIVLSADQGPFGTKDHRMKFEALPLDKTRTFVHVSYSHSYGFAFRLAENIYFATLGLGKVGFTVKGTDSNGNPAYIGGPRGAIERNAVRYYFAIQSFMDTLHYPEKSRFNMRISRWYDLTSRYRKQLFEMEKKDYLTIKTAEHKNQDILQRRIPTCLQ